jgi:23S rRNA (uracil1939-C5)-methyltransferase
VLIEILEERAHFVRGRLVRVLQPSPDRIPPRCKHFGVCGGCHYQHMGYGAQLAAKAKILEDQLSRIGHLDRVPVQASVGSPAEWGYRNQVQFHLTASGHPGYVTSRDSQKAAGHILGIEECHLPEPPIDQLWPGLAFDPTSDVKRVDIRVGSDEEMLVVLEADSGAIDEMEVEGGVSVVHVSQSDTVVLAGSEHIVLEIRGRRFRVSSTSFFQVNTPMAERMVEHVLSQLPGRLRTILDVYCGVGLFSAFLAERSEALIGIEASSSACDDFAYNLDEFNNVELYEDTAEHVLPTLNLQAEAAVVDPPRAGLTRVVLDEIARLSPSRLIYVSCNPSTLARDAQLLRAKGYQLLQVTPFDLFPQTFHIESISVFGK